MIQQIILGVIVVCCIIYIIYNVYLFLFPSKGRKGSKCSSCSSDCLFKDMGLVKDKSNRKGKKYKNELSDKSEN